MGVLSVRRFSFPGRFQGLDRKDFALRRQRRSLQRLGDSLEPTEGVEAVCCEAGMNTRANQTVSLHHSEHTRLTCFVTDDRGRMTHLAQQGTTFQSRQPLHKRMNFGK